MTTTSISRYPILEEFLNLKGLSLQPVYTIRDLARLFSVTPRAIQSRVATGQIQSRNLPGRARFLSEDIEAFLVASRKKVTHGR